jgi:hypothetical protein
MSIWLAVPLAAGVVGALVAVVKRRESRVTSLHIDH